MKAQVACVTQWLALSCGVKTIVLSMREKRGKSAVKERGLGDTAGCF